MRNKFLLLLATVSMFVFFALPVWADDLSNQENKLDNDISDLIQISVGNNIDNDEATIEVNDISNYDIINDVTLDVMEKEKTNQAPQTESYVATVLVTSKYVKKNADNVAEPLLHKDEKGVLLYATFRCTIDFDKIKIAQHSNSYDSIYAYKINSVSGKYEANGNDKYMCKSMALHSSAWGCSHADSSAIGMLRTFYSPEDVISYPSLGKEYTHITNQSHYFCAGMADTTNYGILDVVMENPINGDEKNLPIRVGFN